MSCPIFQDSFTNNNNLFNAKAAFNTVYFFVFFLLYLFASSLMMTTYYATIPEITTDPQSRTRLTHWKAAFDTINYSVAYALLPLVFAHFQYLRILSLSVTPLIVTMIIPLFMVKEPPSYLIIKDDKGQKIKK
jgi:Na+/melibiose symporter-like transporter